jgi:hypothetical protein
MRISEGVYLMKRNPQGMWGLPLRKQAESRFEGRMIGFGLDDWNGMNPLLKACIMDPLPQS